MKYRQVDDVVSMPTMSGENKSTLVSCLKVTLCVVAFTVFAFAWPVLLHTGMPW